MSANLRVIICLCLCFCFYTKASAQSGELTTKLRDIVSRSDSANSKMRGESIVMQTDRANFLLNDTLWFKAYILNSSYLTPTNKSGYLYIDVINKGGELMKRLRFPATLGLSWGYIDLSETSLKPGAYLLRAYTNWMRNFGEDTFLYRPFSIADSTGAVPPALVYKPAMPGVAEAGNTAAKAGTGLHMTTTVSNDSVLVTITVDKSNDLVRRPYFLIARSRGVVCYAAVININSRQFLKALPAADFPAGTAYFDLLDTAGRVLHTTTAMICHDKGLKLKVIADKPEYRSRDSINLRLQVVGPDGQPIKGILSVGVTDDSQVIAESDVTVNSGDVFSNTGSYAMANGLVQKYLSEEKFKISGSVVNVLGKPIPKATVTLLARKPSLVSQTLTDARGRFVFDNIPLTDTAIYVLQAKNKNGRMFNVDIRMDNDDGPPTFDRSALKQAAQASAPVSDSTMVTMVTKQIARNAYIATLTGIKHQLKEVKIVGKKIIKDSKNWNGGGNADVVLDEKELEKADRKTLMQLLEEKVPGFKEGTLFTPPLKVWPEEVRYFDAYLKGTMDPMAWFFVQGKVAMLFVDGIDVKSFIQPFTFPEYRSYLMNTFAADVKGIEVNVSSGYANPYLRHFQLPLQELAYRDFAFIEITTRSGAGPNIKHGIGNYIYKPVPLTFPREFTAIKHLMPKTTTDGPDTRPTIFWSPNVVTGADGKANISFYAGDGPTTYTVAITGTDLNGNFGTATYKLKIR